MGSNKKMKQKTPSKSKDLIGLAEHSSARKTKKPIVKKELAKAPKAKKVITVSAVNVAKTINCGDKNCVVHGSNTIRGRVFQGTVVRAKMTKTVIVQWPRRSYLSKYERFEKRRSKVKAHNAPCVNAKEGDTVKIAECRPLSKDKNFIVIEVLK
jgi:small subunit ribosomal protein S17